MHEHTNFWDIVIFAAKTVHMAFLGYFSFWMGDVEEARWNGVGFLVPKHLQKSKRLLDQIWAKNPYVTFFLGHPVFTENSGFEPPLINNCFPTLKSSVGRLVVS